MKDRIELIGLRGKGFHGVFEQERRTGQDFVVDLALVVDTRAAAASDDLSHTVDYGAVASAVYELITGAPVNLIETLAERIAEFVSATPECAGSRSRCTNHRRRSRCRSPMSSCGSGGGEPDVAGVSES